MNDLQKRADAIGKEPAYPTTFDMHGHGLCKLELFAMNAMKGIISSDSRGEFSPSIIARSAMLCAKSLCLALAESEKEVGNG